MICNLFKLLLEVILQLTLILQSFFQHLQFFRIYFYFVPLVYINKIILISSRKIQSSRFESKDDFVMNRQIYNFNYMSDQKQEKDNPEDIKGSRRSRKDQEGRDYVCGCGKRYLSYPALYTHIKTKHDGKQPEGTQKAGVSTQTKRPKQKPQDKFLRQIQAQVCHEDLRILTQLDQNASGQVQFQLKTSKQILGKQIWEAYLTLMKANTFELDKKSSLESVLAVYLVGAGQFVSESMFSYYSYFANNFLTCYQEHGEQVYEACFKGETERGTRAISIEQCKYAPIICNFFLRYYLTYDKKDEQMLSMMELLCTDFCNWMFQKKLTIVEVNLLKKYKSIRKNIIEKPKQKEKKVKKINIVNEQVDEDVEERIGSHRRSQSSNLLGDIRNQHLRFIEFEQPNNSQDPINNIDLLFSSHN